MTPRRCRRTAGPARTSQAAGAAGTRPHGLGALGSLAYLVENAQQNWSALHLERTLGAAPQVSALGPALFATATALARFTAAALPDRVGDRLMIQLGATVAAAGTALVAAAFSVPTTLVGVVIAGIGTAVCAPTLISLAGRQVPAQRRGRAIATVTALAYLGFLAGPAYVGVVADWAGLPAGLGAVAVVAAVLAVGAAAIPKPRP